MCFLGIVTIEKWQKLQKKQEIFIEYFYFMTKYCTNVTKCRKVSFHPRYNCDIIVKMACERHGFICNTFRFLNETGSVL